MDDEEYIEELAVSDRDDCFDDFDISLEDLEDDVSNTYVKFNSINIMSLLDFESEAIVQFTEEERDVIDQCDDEQLIRLLIFNRAHHSQVRKLMLKLQRMLDQCKRSEERKQQSEEQSNAGSQAIVDFSRTDIWKTAAPYFKDAKFYGAPYNEDVIRKQTKGELCLLKTIDGTRWSIADKRILLSSIKLQTFERQHNELRRLISIKKAEAKKNRSEELKLEIDNLNKEIAAIVPSYPGLNDPGHIDWITISCFKLKGRHSILECMAYWNMVLHPELNTDKWQTKEEDTLQSIAQANNCQDWLKIVTALGTNRSPYEAAKHYFSNLHLKFALDRFTPEEDLRILDAVKRVQMGSYIPWQKVADQFKDRSRQQLYHRYKNYLLYKYVKKGQFSEAEDALLIYLVRNCGMNFSEIVKYFSDRSPVQLRNRYSTYLNKTFIKFDACTQEEDKQILKYVGNFGVKRWAQLAIDLGRTRAYVRHRYLAIKKWTIRNPDKDLSNMPKRKKVSLVNSHVNRNQVIADILRHLEDTREIPHVHELETFSKCTQGKGRRYKKNYKYSFTGADKELIEFFKGTCKFQKESQTYNEEKHAESAKRIVELMDIFNEDTGYLKLASEDDACLSQKMANILTHIKSNLETQPSPCLYFSNNNGVKHCLPPTIRTLVGLRGLIIKANMFSEKLRTADDKSKNQDVPWVVDDAQAYDCKLKSAIEHERKIFYERLLSMFKWPLLLSNQFPSHLKFSEYVINVDQKLTDDINETNQVNKIETKKNAGRPRKVVSAKVILMNKARATKSDKGVQISNSERDLTHNYEPDINQPSTSGLNSSRTTYTITDEDHSPQAEDKYAIDYDNPYNIDETFTDCKDIKLEDLQFDETDDIEVKVMEDVKAIDALIKQEEEAGFHYEDV